MADHRSRSERAGADQRSVLVPLLILVVTYLATQVFQTTQLLWERTALADVKARQEKQVEGAKGIRTRLDKLAADTQLLANRGNESAKLVVDDLRARGITINPQATSPSGGSAAGGAPGATAK